MTKKRFTMYRNIIYDNGNILSPFNCMKVMNTLHNENEQLKSELSKQKEISPKKEIERLKKIISCLREENIDLNEELMEYDSFKKLSKKD